MCRLVDEISDCNHGKWEGSEKVVCSERKKPGDGIPREKQSHADYRERTEGQGDSPQGPVETKHRGSVQQGLEKVQEPLGEGQGPDSPEVI